MDLPSDVRDVGATLADKITLIYVLDRVELTKYKRSYPGRVFLTTLVRDLRAGPVLGGSTQDVKDEDSNAKDEDEKPCEIGPPTE
jgi:hypothetical protein